MHKYTKEILEIPTTHLNENKLIRIHNTTHQNNRNHNE